MMEEYIERNTTSAVRQRARDILKRGLSLSYSFNPPKNLIQAKVRGNFPSNVLIRTKKNDLTTRCNCPYNWGGLSKHEAAVLYHYPENEINKFCPSFRVLFHYGNDRIKNHENFMNYDLIITTYGLVTRDIEWLREFQFNYIILDESQAIKKPLSLRFKAVCLLQGKNRQPQNHCILSICIPARADQKSYRRVGDNLRIPRRFIVAKGV